MSDCVDIKPVFASIRVKQEPPDHVEYKPHIPAGVEDMLRRRPFVKRRSTRKRKVRRRKKRKFKKRRKTTTGVSIKGKISAARKSLFRSLGLDSNRIQRACSPVVQDNLSVSDNEEKHSPQSDPKDTPTPSVPAEDLLDSILEQQEQMLSQNFSQKRPAPLSSEERREKEERRRKRDEQKEEKRRIEEEKRRRQREIRDQEKREREHQELQRIAIDLANGEPPVKRKSRFSDEVPFINAFARNTDLLPGLIHKAPPITNPSPQPMPTIPITTASFNPALALLQQQSCIEQQNAIAMQQQLNLELLAAANLRNQVNPLVAQIIQSSLPQPSLLLPPAQQGINLIGLPPPPPPPEAALYSLANAIPQSSASTSFLPPPTFDITDMQILNEIANDPPPPPMEGMDSRSSKKAHVSTVAAIVKPYADKYGKRYKLSTENYKKMCVKIVKKIAKYNSTPKPDRVERLVQEYAVYLHQREKRHK